MVTNSSVDTFNLGVSDNSIMALDLSPKIRKMRTGLELTTHKVDRIASLGYEKKLTKSQVVPLSYEIFVPLGLFAAIKIRIPLHKLTKADPEWDEPLQGELTKEAGAALEEMVLRKDSCLSPQYKAGWRQR